MMKSRLFVLLYACLALSHASLVHIKREKVLGADPVLFSDLQVASPLGHSGNFADVVSSGVVQAHWAKSTYINDIDKDTPETHFYFQISNSTNRNLNLTSLITPNEIVILDFEKNNVTLIGNADPTSIMFSYTCIGNGTVVINFNVTIDGVLAAVVYLNKTCVFFPNPGDSGFCGSTIDNGVATITRNGAVIPTWNYASSADSGNDVFYFWLSNQSVVKSASGLKYQITAIDYDARVIVVFPTRVMDNALNYSTTSNGSSHIDISYACEPAGGSSFVRVTLNLDGAFNDVTFAYTKTCSTHSSGSGWSPIGIFFFTLLMIIIVVNMGGCIFNYFVRDRRGWDICPGIGVYRQCYQQNCKNDSSHGPQHDNDAKATTQYGAVSSAPQYQSSSDAL